MRDTILSRALALAKRDEVPTEPRELEEFLQGALHDALIKALGPELGLSVSTELERIAAVATRPSGTTPQQVAVSRESTTRRERDTVRPGARTKAVPTSGRRKPRSTLPSPEMLPPGSVKAPDERWAEKERRAIAPTEPAGRRVQAPPARPPSGAREEAIHAKAAPLPVSADYPRGVAKALGVIGTASVDPRPSRRPTVLLASTDPELLRLFTAWLDLRAAVEQASGATALVVRLAEVGGPRAVIVLDGKNPGVRPLTLAALADELPAGTTVILWGVQPHLHARMCTISALAEKWVVYAGDATSTEVVAQCAKIVS
ncbi:MAG TPA: hypothetical protein VMI54_00785 [Polyangiaceae bacterium]|nr:hypothetical protein [Polyangiaceae bacterium]